MTPGPPAEYLRFQEISKTFPGVRALDGISFGVAEGSVHALMGENGAGKSTLLKILGGAYQPTGGSLSLGGVPRRFSSTASALSAGVAIIYQELHLVPRLSVAENLYLGHLPSRAGWVSRRALHEAARQLLALLGEDLDPRAEVGTLSIAQRQMVEIAKALSREAKVIAFDEPTSSLTRRESDRLFAVIRQLRDQGRAILYVSHRMEEIFSVCDAATVFRDGCHVATHPQLAAITTDTLVRQMVGRTIEDIYRYQPRSHGSPALEVSSLSGQGLRELASLTVAKGEIVGVFGLIGAGRSELLRLLAGAVPVEGGTIRVDGQAVSIRRPADAIRCGLVLCPEDRKQEGIVPIRSVQENLNLSARRRHARLGFLVDEHWERANAGEHVRALGVKTPSLAQPIVHLSGGNQQKVILARWLSEEVRVMMLDEPTRGIDIGVKSEIYAILYDLAARGVGVLVVSSELPEVMGICDRLLVMRQGCLVADFARGERSAEEILSHALPLTAAPAAQPTAA